MAVKIIYPSGNVEITVPLSEYLSLSNYGGGIAKIYYLIEATNHPPVYQFQQTLENSEITLGPFSADTKVKIESGNSKVIYDYGSSPNIGTGDASTLNGNSSTYYTNASNIASGTLADGRLPTTVVKTTGTQTVAGEKTLTDTFYSVGGIVIDAAANANLILDAGTVSNVSQIFLKVDGTNKGLITYTHDAIAANEVLTFNIGGATNDVLSLGGNGALTINGNAGASGTFTTSDAKTVTVTNGIITSIV